jgi:hypothetical protein
MEKSDLSPNYNKEFDGQYQILKDTGNIKNILYKETEGRKNALIYCIKI